SYPDNPPVPLGPYPPRPAAYSWSAKTTPDPLPASGRAAYFAPDNSVRHPSARLARGSNTKPRCVTNRSRFTLAYEPCQTLKKTRSRLCSTKIYGGLPWTAAYRQGAISIRTGAATHSRATADRPWIISATSAINR